MEVKLDEAFGDSLLVVQQVIDMFRCLERSPNAYLHKCLHIITYFAKFWIRHISRHEIVRLTCWLNKDAGLGMICLRQ